MDGKCLSTIPTINNLLIDIKPIVCLPWEILHYKISREKLEPEPGFEPQEGDLNMSWHENQDSSSGREPG